MTTLHSSALLAIVRAFEAECTRAARASTAPRKSVLAELHRDAIGTLRSIENTHVPRAFLESAPVGSVATLKRESGSGQWMYRLERAGQILADWQYGPYDQAGAIEQVRARFAPSSIVIL